MAFQTQETRRFSPASPAVDQRARGRYLNGRSARHWVSKAWGELDHHRLSLVTACIALLLVAPILAVSLSLFQIDNGTIAHLTRTVLADYIWNSVSLVIGVALGVFLIGTVSAWLISMCEFPGVRTLEWLLILPLAFPAYILAYAYTDLLSHPGFVQSTLRDLTGWGPRDYWFPNVRSLGGAIMMFVFVLYPYVYLLARSAFLEQSTCYTDVSRALGRSVWQTFFNVSLPLARPAIAGGVALALMETLADYGTVSHFGVHTFTTGIYRAWYSMDDLVAASQLATMLLAMVLIIVVVERLERRRVRFHNARTERQRQRYVLRGWMAWGAVAFCLVPVMVGFFIPVATLIHLHIVDGHDLFSGRYMDLIQNTVTLAGLAALVTVVVALVISYAHRVESGWVTEITTRLATLGYAVPGSVIAIGILVAVAAVDHSIDTTMRELFGVSSGLLLTGTAAALIFGYAVRFMAVAVNPIESSFAKRSASIDAAARTLGETRIGVLRRVHLPLVSGALFTAALMVFVDVMKELPATLILRPFNFDTLAVQAHRLASDERLAQAATPSLVLVAAGLVPVIILSRQIMRSHTGGSAVAATTPDV